MKRIAFLFLIILSCSAHISINGNENSIKETQYENLSPCMWIERAPFGYSEWCFTPKELEDAKKEGDKCHKMGFGWYRDVKHVDYDNYNMGRLTICVKCCEKKK